MPIRLDGDNATATPGITGGDADTGLVFGTDEVSIVTGGTQHVNVNANGDVDLGGLTVSGSAADDSVNIDSSGRLLVGTSSGVASNTAEFQGNSFSSSGPANVYIKLGATNPSSGSAIGNISFSDSTGSVAGLINCASDGTWGTNDYPGRLVFSTTANSASSPTERMRITSDDRVFLRTTTGAINSSNFGTVLTWSFLHSRNVSGISAVAQFYGNAGECRIMGNGDLENTNNSLSAISDIKFKQNIEDCNSQWDDIKGIRVRKYELKEHPECRHIGVVAQELEQVCPGLVVERWEDDEGKETYKSVVYSVLYMKAVKALQEAMERIETLEAKVAALEANP